MIATFRAQNAGSLLSSGRSLPGAACWSLAIVRVASAVVFISFGVGKFVNHASEAASFRTYGLPWPGGFTLAIGVLELVGGLLLLVGLKTRITSVLLAGDMVGAIVVSGLLQNETISLTLAPALLVGMMALAVWGPGSVALDTRGKGDRKGDRVPVSKPR